MYKIYMSMCKDSQTTDQVNDVDMHIFMSARLTSIPNVTIGRSAPELSGSQSYTIKWACKKENMDTVNKQRLADKHPTPVDRMSLQSGEMGSQMAVEISGLVSTFCAAEIGMNNERNKTSDK